MLEIFVLIVMIVVGALLHGWYRSKGGEFYSYVIGYTVGFLVCYVQWVVFA